jgi:hypothetical protein
LHGVGQLAILIPAMRSAITTTPAEPTRMTAAALDLHRFADRPWWDDPVCRAQVDALRVDARAFQIMTCTAGGLHLREVTGSFIEMIEHAGLCGQTRAGRPLLRWLLVERGPCLGVAEMAETLAGHGVEVLRRPALATAEGSIAEGRRALLHAAANLDLDDDPIVLLLDDDLAFDALYSGPHGVKLGAPWPWLPAVWAFHAAHPECDVALGGVTGAPPLPASSTLATNLFDLEAALRGWPTSMSAQRWSEVDHYYDLSPVRTVSSAYPMLGPELRGPALLDVLMIHGALARPLVATPTTLARARPATIVRGGNTIVFDRKWLTLPHPQAQLGALRLRRADTIWTQAATSLHGCEVGQFPLPLRHLRDESGWTELSASRWRERLLADLGGVGLYRGIERWRTRTAWQQIRELVHATNDVVECFAARRAQVVQVLDEARRRCAALLGLRPELETVGAAIDGGLAAIVDLELGSDAISQLLAGLCESLEAHA